MLLQKNRRNWMLLLSFYEIPSIHAPLPRGVTMPADPSGLPPTATSDEERERALSELFASWDAHPVRPDAPRLTRDEMHERR